MSAGPPNAEARFAILRRRIATLNDNLATDFFAFIKLGSIRP